MSILNRGWIYDSITRNKESGSVSYRWTYARFVHKFLYIFSQYHIISNDEFVSVLVVVVDMFQD